MEEERIVQRKLVYKLKVYIYTYLYTRIYIILFISNYNKMDKILTFLAVSIH